MNVEFLTELDTRRAPRRVLTPWLRGRATRWQLIQDFVVAVDGRVIVVPAGYIFNGSSIPWWLWWLFPPTYDPAWRAAAIHDYIYSHLYVAISKSYADEVFYYAMLADGAKPFVAKKFYWAVSTFGKGGW